MKENDLKRIFDESKYKNIYELCLTNFENCQAS